MATDDNNADPESLTHVDSAGKAHMVDVTSKDVTVREAEARGSVFMAGATLALVRDNALAKGDVLGVARVAGTMAAKRTPDLIPLAHGLPLTGVTVDFDIDADRGRIDIRAAARTEAKTGVEMEALTAVAVAALAIYDMCKGVDKHMVIGEIRLTYKSGGRSGTFKAQ